VKGRKINDTRGIQGSWDGQAKGNSESYEGEQDLEVGHGTNLHYFHQYNYILARNESGAAKIRVFSIRRVRKINP